MNKDIGVLIELAKKYNDLGWSVQEQFDQYLKGNTEDLNPSAVKMIEEFLKEAEHAGFDVNWPDQDEDDLVGEEDRTIGIEALVREFRSHKEATPKMMGRTALIDATQHFASMKRYFQGIVASWVKRIIRDADAKAKTADEYLLDDLAIALEDIGTEIDNISLSQKV